MAHLEPCDACGTVPDACSFCDSPAYHFFEANVWVGDAKRGRRVDATIFLCEQHEVLLGQEFHDGELPEDVFVELAMYMPNTNCSQCDPWR